MVAHEATIPRPVGRPRIGLRMTGRWDADVALEELYAAHWSSLVRLATLLLRDQGTAEEVVQDAFVAMHDRWGRLQDPSKGLAYLRATVVNKARSVLRHRKVVTAYVDRTPPASDTPGADHALLQSARRSDVLAALGALPVRQREVLVLRYYLDLSEHDIAATLGISKGAVKSHASRGSASLRTLLSDHLEDLR